MYSGSLLEMDHLVTTLCVITKAMRPKPRIAQAGGIVYLELEKSFPVLYITDPGSNDVWKIIKLKLSFNLLNYYSNDFLIQHVL